MEILGIVFNLDDPRRDLGKKYTLQQIFTITILAALTGCDDWYEVEDFGNTRFELLKRYLPDLERIPSHDTFNRVFSILDPNKFEEAYREWIQAFAAQYKGVIAIDGKTIRGACEKDADGKIVSKLHVITAWASNIGVSLGQLMVGEKTNEITADPELIRSIDVKGNIVTIDAMGCQKEITKVIVERGGDFVIGLKNNQKHFCRHVADLFEKLENGGVARRNIIKRFGTEETGHGRIEKRTYKMISGYWDGAFYADWDNVHSVVRVTSERTVMHTGEKSVEQSFYVTSITGRLPEVADAIRRHWSIENNLHWQLDISFDEDDTRKKKNAARNWSLISKIVLMVLKKHPCKLSIRSKRKKAAYDETFLMESLEILANLPQQLKSEK